MQVRGAATLSDAEREAFNRIIAAIWTRPESQQMFADDMRLYQDYDRMFAPFFAIAADEAGVAGVFIMITSVTSDELLTISWAAVDPARQGNGTGRRLLEACLHEAERREKKLLVATSVPKFFERCGLRIIEEYYYTQPRFLLIG